MARSSPSTISGLVASPCSRATIVRVVARMRFDAIGVLVDAEGAVVDLQHIEG
jgi:hypothetical protein